MSAGAVRPFDHACLNPVFLIEVGGEGFVLVGVTLAPQEGGPVQTYLVRLTRDDFEWLVRLFPNRPWRLCNDHVAIETHDPHGRRLIMYAARALLFRRKLEAGEPNPSTKGVVCRYGPGGLLDLTPANLRAEPAKERHARSGYETGWAVEWRLKLLAEGGDPDTLKEADAEAAE